MASKAHVIHDYSFGHARTRPRRQLWFPLDEPVELPRSSIWSTGGGALVTVLTMASLVVGSAYAASRSVAPSLAETPTLPLAETWQPDPSFAQATLTNLLTGPALAAPDKAVVINTPLATDAPKTEAPKNVSHAHEVISDDSAPYPAETRAAPYPNPTTTPPDAIAPPHTDPLVPTPLRDPENPYRDSE